MTNGIIYLPNVRLSFPHLVEPQISKSPETGLETRSWNCEILLPPDDENYLKFMRQVNVVAVEKWKENAPTVLQMIQADRKTRCYARGEEKISKKTFKPYDTHVGLMSINSNRYTPPQMIRPDGSPVDPMNTMEYQAIARSLYPGCRVNVALKPWAQNNKHGVGIRSDLVAIQFAGDDKPFGEGQVDVTPLFGAVTAAQPKENAPTGMPDLPSWVR